MSERNEGEAKSEREGLREELVRERMGLLPLNLVVQLLIIAIRCLTVVGILREYI